MGLFDETNPYLIKAVGLFRLADTNHEEAVSTFGLSYSLTTYVNVGGIWCHAHTRYFTPSAQWLTQQLWPDKLSFSELDYEYPAHFTLHNVSIETKEQPLSFSKVDIWLNEKLIKQDKLVIDSLLLDGANFSQGLPSSDFLQNLQLNQLALHNVDFSHQGLIARGVNLQVKHPQWRDHEQLLPYGELQLSADQFIGMVKLSTRF